MPFDESQGRLVAVLMTGLAGLLVLLRISLPLNRLRLILLAAMAALFLTALLLFPGLLYLPAADARSFLVACAFAAWVYPLILILERLLGRATKMRESPGHAKHS
jgi:hypothetical protein